VIDTIVSAFRIQPQLLRPEIVLIAEGDKDIYLSKDWFRFVTYCDVKVKHGRWTHADGCV
jgi:hypothetical protein